METLEEAANFIDLEKFLKLEMKMKNATNSLL